MRMRSVWIGLLLCSSVVPLAAQASIGFGPQIGFYKARDSDNSRVMGGVALRVRLSDALGIEGSVNYREEGYLRGAVHVKNWPIMVTGLLYPVPFVYGAVGAGWYTTSIDYNVTAGGTSLIASETTQAFGWHFGGGVDVPLGSAARLVGDVRYVFLNYDFKTLPGSNGVNSNFYVLTAGLLFSL